MTTTVTIAEAPATRPPREQQAPVTIRRSTRIWRELRQNRLAAAGAAFLVLIVLAAACAPLLSHYDPAKQDLLSRLDPPSASHWLGTDEVGRDVFSRLAFGARISLFVALLGTAGGVIIGTVVGLICGFFGGWTDTLLMRIVDVMYAFPGVLLVILIVSVLGPSLWNLILALMIWGTPTLSRIVRASVLSLKAEDYVLAARTIGANRARLMLTHLLPNAMAPIIVYATLGVAGSLLTAAGLGFLGLGVQPPTPEWGAMLSDGREYVISAPYLVTFPGLLIFLTVLALNFIGDALRDALDPRTQR
ncbi:MAG: ABC transporter permease [Chloroflexi bacterium]|nr:ABC transporter permease [Chloroflexota bacterium]MBV9544324.1 ABC transporter permease [Chloroflexota bacterium]